MPMLADSGKVCVNHAAAPIGRGVGNDRRVVGQDMVYVAIRRRLRRR